MGDHLSQSVLSNLSHSSLPVGALCPGVCCPCVRAVPAPDVHRVTLQSQDVHVGIEQVPPRPPVGCLRLSRLL